MSIVKYLETKKRQGCDDGGYNGSSGENAAVIESKDEQASRTSSVPGSNSEEFWRGMVWKRLWPSLAGIIN
jgi:hypothetical protein